MANENNLISQYLSTQMEYFFRKVWIKNCCISKSCVFVTRISLSSICLAKQLTVSSELDGADFATVMRLREGGDALAGNAVPDLDGAVGRSADVTFAVRRPLDARNRVCVLQMEQVR